MPNVIIILEILSLITLNTSNIITINVILSSGRSDFFMLKVDADRQKARKKALKRLETTGNIPLIDPSLQFGYTLKKIRVMNGIKGQTLASEAYMFHSRLSEYERGKRLPTIQNLELLIAALIRLGANPMVGDELQEAFRATLPQRNNQTSAAVYKVLTK